MFQKIVSYNYCQVFPSLNSLKVKRWGTKIKKTNDNYTYFPESQSFLTDIDNYIAFSPFKYPLICDSVSNAVLCSCLYNVGTNMHLNGENVSINQQSTRLNRH